MKHLFAAVSKLATVTAVIAALLLPAFPARANVTVHPVAVSAGDMFSIALMSDGTVMAWGKNASGQLGDGTTTDRTSPVQVQGLANVIAIDAGNDFSLALKADGTVWGWGYNYFGQLGDNTTTDRHTPVQTQTPLGITTISAGGYHSMALKADGTVWTWGRNAYGQIGNGTTSFSRNFPYQVSGLSGIQLISAGGNHSMAFKADVSGSTSNFWIWDFEPYKAYVWGDNTYGQLCDGTTTQRIGPELLSTMYLSPKLNISAGANHSLMLGTGVSACGNNFSGQLGDGTFTNRNAPVPVRLPGWSLGIFIPTTALAPIAISGGGSHSLALMNDDTVWSWGYNAYGQLGLGNTTDENWPGKIAGLSNVTAIAAGGYHSLALEADGSVWSWGYNSNGQLGLGSYANHTTPVQIPGLGIPPASLNHAPGAPTQVSPRDGYHFGMGEAQTFTIQATDPDGDAYTGTVIVRDTSRNIVATFNTSSAASGNNSSGAPPTPLPADSYLWTAKATDVKGAEGAESAEQWVHVDSQAKPQGPGQLMVSFASGANKAAAHAAAGATYLRTVYGTNIDVVSTNDMAAAMSAYQGRTGVYYAELDDMSVAAGAPNDPDYGQQWNYHPITDWEANPGSANLEPVIGTSMNGSGIVVAVVDTGVSMGGVDLDSAHVAQGYNAVTGGTSTYDSKGHGTFVAGIIAQTTNNGTGVAGIAPGATILPIKVFNDQGTSNTDLTASGIRWAADHGAKVINLSVSNVYSKTECDQVSYAISAGAVVVAGSGNDGRMGVTYPAACPGAIAVGSIGRSGVKSSFSNFGPELALVAPGENIVQEDYNPQTGLYRDAPRSGTSVSTPHVSGAAALLLQNGYSASNVRGRLTSTARDLGTAGRDDMYGNGALDIAAALGVNNACATVGYWMVASDGGIFSFGNAQFHGSTGATQLNGAVVGMAATPSGGGYWLVGSDGGVFAFGDAGFYGSLGGIRLSSPIVGIAATSNGGGYWLVGQDGSIYTFGNAGYHGSMASQNLNAPIVGMAATPSDGGYWLVGADGGIFAFGNAAFYGSTGGIGLQHPIVGMARTPNGAGYWMVGSGGEIFAYGNATYYGSTGNMQINKPIVGMAPTSTGAGYWLVASDGGIFSYGNAPFCGSTGAMTLNRPIVGMARRP
jgi:alpha-tubulin suppressor-like RCC1 family protein/subtilisin family serine protease